MFHYFAESLWLGTWALWNPYVHGGEPFYYAWGILRLLDPITLVMIGLGKLLGIRLFDLYHFTYVLRIVVTMAGVYLVFRYLLRSVVSLFIVLLVGTWGYLAVSSLTSVGALDAFCWFPWAFLCLLKAVSDRTRCRGAWVVGFAYFVGTLVGASVYHWAYSAFVLTMFTLSLLVNRREDLRRLLEVDRRIWIAALVLLLALVAPLAALPPERGEIVPTARLHDRERERTALSRILGVDYRDIRERSPQVGLGSYASAGALFRWLPHYEAPETSFVARLLLVIGLIFGRHRYKYHLLAVAGLTFFLYAGPTWPLEFLHEVLYFSFPPLWLARHLSVFDPFVYFFVLFFIGIGVDGLIGWLAQRKPQDLDVEGSSRWGLTVGSALALAVAAIFAWVWPLRSNFFTTMYPGMVPTKVLVGVVVLWCLGWAVGHRVLVGVRYALPLLLGLSILVMEQWTIAAYLERPGPFSWASLGGCGCVKQLRSEYFKDFHFPRRGVRSFQPPANRVAGLNLSGSYLAYSPTLLKVNAALEDLLPARGGGDPPYLAAFPMRFPMGLYHFWLKSYFQLYEIGETRPAVFESVMGIGKSLIEFYPRFSAMTQESQRKLFSSYDVDDVRAWLARMVFIPSVPAGFTPSALERDGLYAFVEEPFNGSFEQWAVGGSPARWSYEEGGTGGRVVKVSDPAFVKAGESAAMLMPSSTGPSFIRYAVRDVEKYKGRLLVVRVWVKSDNKTPGAVQGDLQTGSPGAPVTVAVYRNAGDWEELTLRRQIEQDASYLLLSLSISNSDTAPAVFDAVRMMVSRSTEMAGFEQTVRYYDPNRLELDVKADRDGILLYRDNYHHSWLAKVDGVRIQLQRADMSFKAIALAKGQHRVVFEYRPLMFLGCLYAYLAANGAAVVFAVGLTGRLARRH